MLLGLAGGRMAPLALAPGQLAAAVSHRTVAEIGYVLQGERWCRQDGREAITPLVPGLCLTVPPGSAFRFRATPHEGRAGVRSVGSDRALPARDPGGLSRRAGATPVRRRRAGAWPVR